MVKFIASHQDQISGVLSGFDCLGPRPKTPLAIRALGAACWKKFGRLRQTPKTGLSAELLVFRATLRSIAYAQGMNQYLSSNQILLKQFGTHVEQLSQRLKVASLAEAVSAGRPVPYLASARVSKEDIARAIALEDGIRQGLVCVLTSVEPCRTFEVYRDRETKHLQLQPPHSQVPVPVPLRHPSGVRVPQRAHVVDAFALDLVQDVNGPTNSSYGAGVLASAVSGAAIRNMLMPSAQVVRAKPNSLCFTVNSKRSVEPRRDSRSVKIR